MMPHSIRRRVIASAVAFSMVCGTTVRAGNLNDEMSAMFNSLGGTGNFTEPGAFRGQSLNTYSGGSLMYRAPVRTYRLMPLVEYPSARGSCAGIDAFAGSFSIISSEKLKAMLQQITSALPGLAFQLAVEAVSPAFASKIQWLKDLESNHTIGAMNTCSIATSLVRGASRTMNYDSQKGCEAVAGLLSLTEDQAAAQKECAGANKTTILNDAERSSDPMVKKELPVTGNIVWQALKEVDDASLSDEERELIMSLVGTVIYGQKADGTKETKLPTITRIEQLMFGGEGDTAGTPEAPVASAKIKLLVCADDHVRCLDVREKDYDLKPFASYVREKLFDIVNAIKNREDLTSRRDLVRFINAVPTPVYRMLAMATYSADPSPAYALIDKYQVLIAAEYAAAFLDRYITAGVHLAGTNGRLSPPQLEEIRELQKNGRSLMSKLASVKLDVNMKVTSMSTLTTELETLTRVLRSTGPLQVMGGIGATPGYAP